MFFFSEIPDSEPLYALADKYVELSHELAERLDSASTELLISRDADIQEALNAVEASVVKIVSGSFTFSVGQSKVFAFEQGDVFERSGQLVNDLAGNGGIFTLSSEFAVKVAYLSPSELDSCVLADVQLFKLFTHLRAVFTSILGLFLSDSRTGDDSFDPQVLFFEAGEVIIQEGDASDEVFTLAQGYCDVTVKDVSVGDIQEGEVFGVIAAFTGTPRTATVKAASKCMVLKLPKAHFNSLVRSKPSVITSLVESLSRTISELNAKVVQHQ